jgi:beta-lactamase regulating signal transducer with metallopeptidase domain/Tol biopolymer transport system component/5-hydroxyisourate hydrolase-like protein (transthyretin family)
MQTAVEFPTPLLEGLLRASWQAAILVALVLLLLRLFRRWLAPRWRHALWLLVLARLLLPVTPAAAWSMFNWLPGHAGLLRAVDISPPPTTVPAIPSTAEPEQSKVAAWSVAADTDAPPRWERDASAPLSWRNIPFPAGAVVPPAGAPIQSAGESAQSDGGALSAAGEAGARPRLERGASAAPSIPGAEVPVASHNVHALLKAWFWPGLWLAGVGLLGGRVVWTSLRFRQALRAASQPVTDLALTGLLAECRRRLRVRRAVAAFETDRVQSPALCGWRRPRLLLPAGLARRLTHAELRHVLLHELAHLRRGDILVNWLATVAQVLHWFNPAVWYALRRLRADRELAADHLALAALGEDHAQGYGRTILKLVASFTRPVAVPAAVGILEDKRAMRERIAAIAAFRRPGRWSGLAAVWVAGLAFVTLTDAQPRPAETAGGAMPSAEGRVGSDAAAGTLRFRPLDLAPHYVTRWDTIKPGTSWAAVPKGLQTFDDVPFDLGGLLELSGLGALRDNKQFPTRVEGIAVGGPLAALHLFHGAGYDAPDGTPIARLVLHYADGQSADLPLRYGVHVRNWWVERGEKSGVVSDPATRVAWTGTSPETDAFGGTLRLFHTRLANPRPDQPVVSVDVVSLLTRVTPVIVAMTAEAPGAGPGATPPAAAAVEAKDRSLAAAGDATSPKPASSGECRLRLVAADSGQPVAGASVRLQVANAQGSHAFGEHHADREGRVTLDFPPEGITQFTLVARAPGHLPRQEVLPGPRLPRELTLRLERGVRIGGVVRDDQGRPVPGVRVQVNGVMRDAVGQFLELELEAVKTDGDGRWTSRSAPPKPEGLNFKLSHPGFFPAEYDQADEAGERLVSTRSLLAGEAVMTIEPGIEIYGQVSLMEGNRLKPVAEAGVMLASGDEFATRRETRTHADGHFRLLVLETGEAMLLVQAAGRAPELAKIQLERGLKPLFYTLQPGRTIEGRVTDERDQPVPGAVVTIERWQDLSLLNWRAETDAEGRFRKDGAPLEAVTLAVSKWGFNQTTQELSGVAAPEISFVPLRLARVFLFTGRVLDAETGQPVTAFRLVRGDVWGGLDPDQTNWQSGREQPTASADGSFSVGLDYDSGGQVRFLAAAEGYLPEVSPVLASTGWHEHTFKLKKGSGPQGVVVNAAGQPVAGAEVGIVGFGYLQLGQGAFRPFGGNQLNLTKTDAEGRFKLPALLPNPTLLAVDPDHGFAEITTEAVAAAGKIVLQPWGRIEGVFKIGSQSAVDREVALVNRALGPGDWHLDFNAYKTRTDSAGRFAIDKAPPGERQLMRPVPIGRGGSWSHLQRVTVKTGAVTQVVYGGTGRPVIGKVVLSDPRRKLDWTSGHHSLSTRFPQPPPEMRTPEGYRAWQKSPEFREAVANQRHYAPTWQPDGSFRFDDVAAGQYQLNLHFVEPADSLPQTPLGFIVREVEVPEIPGGQSDEPLDLGELRLELRSEQEIAADRARQAEAPGGRASAGERLPTLDGGTFDATQMEGKFVLMTAWSATNEASHAELQLLKRLHAEYAGDGRLVMLGAVMDDDLEPARKLVAELEIKWPQIVPPAGMKRDLPRQFPDAKLPLSVFGRTGDSTQPTPLRGEAVLEAVRQALGEPVKSAAPTPATAEPDEARTEPAPAPAAAEDAGLKAAPAPDASGVILRDTAPAELRGVKPRLWTAVFSPDGRTLATTAGWDNPREPGELVLWDVATGRPRVVIRQESTIRTAAFSPDGRRLAIGDFAGQITLLDPANGGVVRALPQQTKLVNSVVFAPDGRTLASGGFDETVRLWDVETGEARRAFVLPGQGVVKIAISPDGQWLAAGTWPGKLHVWRLPAGEKAHELDASAPRTAEAVEFSPDGKTIVTGSWDGHLRVWSVPAGEGTSRLARDRTGVMAAAFSPDGRLLASSDDRGVVELWLVATGAKLGTIPAHDDRCHGLAISPDGRRLATAGWDRVVKIWKVENRQLEATFSR